MKIIIFEDDESLANLLEQMLTLKGHTVHCFPDPTVCPIFKDHEKKCPKDKPCADVVISDYMMPNMTGISFFKLQRERGCKALDSNKAIVTGSVIDADMKEEIKELGCHYFKKPFRVAEILDWVDECEKRLH